MGGRATLPGGAFYHASKYAVEAFSDALRMEVAQFGIEVVLIEPGPVKTPWNDTAAGSLGERGQRLRNRSLRGLQGRGRCLLLPGDQRPAGPARLRCAGHRQGHHPGGHRSAAAHPLSDQPGRQERGDAEPAAARPRLRRGHPPPVRAARLILSPADAAYPGRPGLPAPARIPDRPGLRPTRLPADPAFPGRPFTSRSPSARTREASPWLPTAGPAATGQREGGPNGGDARDRGGRRVAARFLLVRRGDQAHYHGGPVPRLPGRGWAARDQR